MARQQRSTTFAQESTRPIAQVALYARVSTLNNQDPEMQFSELREYAGRRGCILSGNSQTRAFPAARSPGRHSIASWRMLVVERLTLSWCGRSTGRRFPKKRKINSNRLVSAWGSQARWMGNLPYSFFASELCREHCRINGRYRLARTQLPEES